MRIYPVTFEKVSIIAAQDLFEIFWPASTYKVFKILRQWLDVADTALPGSGFLALRSRILKSAVTNGSGGGSAQIGASIGDSAASFTANCNNTTKAIGGGGNIVKHEDGFHLFQGHEWMYDDPPIVVGGSGASFVFELLDAPAAAIKFSGGLLIGEEG